MNVVGNEMTRSGFPYGLFMLNGNGHYSYGNNINGTTNPSGTQQLELNSLYLNENQLPDFLNENTLPMVGYSLYLNEKQLPAQQRFEIGVPISCSEAIVTSITKNETNPKDLISMLGNELVIAPELLPAVVNVYSINGQLESTQKTNSNSVELQLNDAKGIYVISVIGNNGRVANIKTTNIN